MKKIFLFLVLICFVITSFSQEKLTNQSILKFHKLGFDSNIIKSKINVSLCAFNTSIDSLGFLKENGVPTDVLAMMIEKSNVVAESGIFYYNDNNELIKIEPSVFAGTKTNALAAGLTYGIASAKIKSYIPNASSKNFVSAKNLSFIFQFDKKQENNLGSGNWWFKTASSPNEFVLTKLEQKKDKRELTTGKITVVTASTRIGVDPKDAIKFNIEDLGAGRYKVNVEYSLMAGEYCFFYQGTVPMGGYNNQSIFDFTVRQ